MEPNNNAAAVRELEISRVFDAPRTLVFKMWIVPEYMARWWGPQGFTNPICQLDVRPGGVIRILMTGPDGQEYPMGGYFQEIDEPERLVFTAIKEDEQGRAELEILNTVTFTEENGLTTQTLKAEVLKIDLGGQDALGGFKQGWSQSLDRLEALLQETSRR
jgi:uncharacterized protein YndB with AHSA1/START domain